MATDYQLVGPYGSDYPVAVVGNGRRAGASAHQDEVILAVFPAHSWDAAVAQFRAVQNAGIQRSLTEKHGPTYRNGYWSFTGIDNYLGLAAVRLGISTGTIQGAHQDRSVVEVNRKLGECYDAYQAVKGTQRSNRDFTPMERRHAEALIGGCDGLTDRLHAMADACRAASDDCRSVFGLPPRAHRHRILTAREIEAVATAEKTPHLQAELEQVRADLSRVIAAHEEAVKALDRIKAENAELLDQNRQLVTMVEQLTTPAPAPTPEPEVEVVLIPESREPARPVSAGNHSHTPSRRR